MPALHLLVLALLIGLQVNGYPCARSEQSQRGGSPAGAPT